VIHIFHTLRLSWKNITKISKYSNILLYVTDCRDRNFTWSFCDIKWRRTSESYWFEKKRWESVNCGTTVKSSS